MLIPEPRRWRYALSAGALLATLGLSCQFTSLVHTRNWTGNPASSGPTGVEVSSLLASLYDVSPPAKFAANSYPSGWLPDLPIWDTLPESFREVDLWRSDAEPTWHTWLTGLYSQSYVRQDLWYPGGPVAEVWARIDVRDRPAR
jgi:hypothetical protein